MTNLTITESVLKKADSVLKKDGTKKEPRETTSATLTLAKKGTSVARSPSSKGSDSRVAGSVTVSKSLSPKNMTSAQVVRDSNMKIGVLAKSAVIQNRVAAGIARWMEQLRFLLNNINERLENSNQQGAELLEEASIIIERIQESGRASRADAKMLQSIGGTLKKQDETATELSDKLSDISSLINKRHDDIGKMQGGNTSKIVSSLRAIQTEQQDQIRFLIEKNSNMNRLIIVLMLLVVAGMIVNLL